MFYKIISYIQPLFNCKKAKKAEFAPSRKNCPLPWEYFAPCLSYFSLLLDNKKVLLYNKCDKCFILCIFILR